jgi:quinoprotein glucose dehydrogenase
LYFQSTNNPFANTGYSFIGMQKTTYPSFLIFRVLFVFILTAHCSVKHKEETGDWPVYLSDEHSSHYSGLTSINRKNVSKLKPVWEYHSGDDVSSNRSQIQCNPIIIDGILYGTSPRLQVFALNASTGKELWKFDPAPASKSAPSVNRGVTFWKTGLEKRIMFTYGEYLYSLDAETGKRIMTFGDSGRVSLKAGLGERAKDLYVAATSPGIVFEDLFIIGSRVSENAGAAPGYIRAYNAVSGELVWVFHTIPLPGEPGYETWPKDWQTAGAANSWAGMSLDTERGIVYIPTGSAAFDFWGGDRKGANLFANCILALDARTGKRRWHYQTIHHDIWDRDLPAPPNLVTVNHNGRKTDAVAQVTKTGFVFLLDRETGVPLFPVEERPVPSSGLAGEEAWPTQPFPLLPPPFVPQSFTFQDITDISPESHEYVSAIFKNIHSGEMFIPPSIEGTMIFPGFDGGSEWGGAAVDPVNSVLYVNGNIMPWILEMVDLSQESEKNLSGGSIYKINCAVCHGSDRQGDPSGTYPSLRKVKDKYSKKEILFIINNGKSIMPSFRYLGETEKSLVADYLLERNKKELSTNRETGDGSSIVPFAHKGYNRFFDMNGYPAVKPPWGNLSAIDLNNGKILWQVTLGEFPELTAKGIPPTGTENYGGPAVTAGGVIFIGASKDGYFRAFDKDTGSELWKYKLPAGGYATPSIYEADGKQFVVIACGGGKMGTPSGDSYVAFSLSE